MIFFSTLYDPSGRDIVFLFSYNPIELMWKHPLACTVSGIKVRNSALNVKGDENRPLCFPYYLEEVHKKGQVI